MTAHLNADELEALAKREILSPEAGAHFAQCQVCQGRLRETYPGAGPKILQNLSEVLKQVKGLDGEDLEGQMRNSARQASFVESRIRSLLTGGDFDTSELDEFPAVMIGAALIRVSPDYRLINMKGILRICLYLIEPLRDSDFLQYGQAASDLLAQIEIEAANSYRNLGPQYQAPSFVLTALNRVRPSTDLRVKATVLWLAALYYRDARDFGSAEKLARFAESAFTSLGCLEEVQAIRLLLAVSSFMQGDLEEAESRVQKVLAVKPQAVATELGAVQLRARILVLEGHYFAAGRLLPRLRELASAFGDCPAIEANLTWLRARILGSTGSPTRAVELLVPVFSYFESEGIAFDAALAASDLAFFLLRAGSHREAAATAQSALKALEAEGLGYPESFAALKTLSEAIQGGTATSRLYRTLARRIELSRYNASLVRLPSDGVT